MVCLGGGTSLSGQTHPEIAVVDEVDGGRFGQIRVAHWPEALGESLNKIEDWSSMLHVHTIDNGTANPTAMLGQHSLQQNMLFFEPRFPLQPERGYQVVLELEAIYRTVRKTLPENLPSKIVAEVKLPVTIMYPPPVVEAIYPSADTIPANQLKIYIEFDQPMQSRSIYDHLQLVEEHGDLIEAPFLELEPVLWDPTGTRLTVWFDPGRIKTGLQPHRKMGPPLKAGHKYRLVIDPKWQSERDVPIVKTNEKNWTVVAADRERPNPGQWEVLTPHAGSKEPLMVSFPESLDYALLQSAVAIRKSDGRFLEGEISLGDWEKRWFFTPNEVWVPGDYYLRISADLEDLAGNNLNRLFDTNLELPQQKVKMAPFLEIQFKIN